MGFSSANPLRLKAAYELQFRQNGM